MANKLSPVIGKSKKEIRIFLCSAGGCIRVGAFLQLHSLIYSSIPVGGRYFYRPCTRPDLIKPIFKATLFQRIEEYERVCFFGLPGLLMAHLGVAQLRSEECVLPAYRTGEDTPITTSGNSNVLIFDGAEDSDTVGQITVLF